jgi:hypothetical protein
VVGAEPNKTMETNKRQIEMNLNDQGYTYVFEAKEEMVTKVPSKFRRTVWQVLPSICGKNAPNSRTDQ